MFCSLFAKFDEVLILRLFDKAMHCIYYLSKIKELPYILHLDSKTRNNSEKASFFPVTGLHCSLKYRASFNFRTLFSPINDIEAYIHSKMLSPPSNLSDHPLIIGANR